MVLCRSWTKIAHLALRRVNDVPAFVEAWRHLVETPTLGDGMTTSHKLLIKIYFLAAAVGAIQNGEPDPLRAGKNREMLWAL